MKLCVFGITYGDKATEYVEHKNTATDKLHRFEYNPMLEIIENRISHLAENDYLGIFSWKFQQKTGLSKAGLVRLLSKAEQGAEVYNLSPNLGDNIAGCGNFMDWSCKGHGELLRYLIKACCEHINMPYDNDPDNVIYANQFITEKWTYEHYIYNCVKPCIELMESDKYWGIVNVPAGYTAGVNNATLKKHTGLDFYNYLPFVLERMAMQYFNGMGWKIINLI